MSKELDEKNLHPVASLHDFLFELDKEWGKFRNGSVIGLISSGTLFTLIVLMLFRFRRFDLARARVILTGRHVVLLKAQSTTPEGQTFTLKLGGFYTHFWAEDCTILRIRAKLLTDDANYTLLLKATI